MSFCRAVVRIRILALQETNYVNEWLGMLENHDVTALLIKPNPGLMSIKSYYSYSDKHVKKIYVPYQSRGRRVASVGLFDHIFYTLFSLACLPLALKNDLIVFVTPSYFHTISMPFLRLFGKKIYLVVIDPQEVLKKTAEESFPKKIYYKFASFLETMAVRMADKVFVVSTYLKKDYERLNKNIFYTPNGADVEYISSLRPKRIFREKTITYFGSLDSWRGVDVLIDAFRAIEKSHKAKLLVLGGGKEEERLREMCKGSKNIRLSGFIGHRDAIALCKGSDVLVIPFRNSPILYKTMPIKTFEYVACGVPIVVTNTGEHARIIKELDVGILVDPDPKSMADGLKKMLGNDKFYKALKSRCRKNMSKVDYKTMRKGFLDEINRESAMLGK